ncbi:MAG: hypothetical protein Q7V09_14975 [Hydrogenophaga sp.]|uniref:hypothetical protein n=1 Tax=Hydrogenophaga sp. TaxID=1904254 RepID=UPI0027212FD0|nr:hypothetical protein [Hydrogenophaga sp.]MDO9031734.1 hypothetical protein [Hydrogenophaga sp.]
MNQLETRALAAYLKAWDGSGHLDQPGDVSEIERGGLRYVRLSNTNGTLAVYRVRIVNDAEVLKRLKRWPDIVDK